MAYDVEIHPPQLRTTSSQLRADAKKIQACIDEVDGIIKSLGSNVFEGNRAQNVRNRYARLRDSFYSFRPFIEKFGIELEETAVRFEKADGAK